MTQNDLRRIRMFHRSQSVSEGSATPVGTNVRSYVMVWPPFIPYQVCSENMGVACMYLYLYRYM